jgi:hypothetical protein
MAPNGSETVSGREKKRWKREVRKGSSLSLRYFPLEGTGDLAEDVESYGSGAAETRGGTVSNGGRGEAQNRREERQHTTEEVERAAAKLLR